jgi:hypothetical protein
LGEKVRDARAKELEAGVKYAKAMKGAAKACEKMGEAIEKKLMKDLEDKVKANARSEKISE